MQLANTYTRVSFASTSGAAVTRELVAASTSGGISRLHALHCTATTTGEIQVLSGAVALTGKWTVPGASPQIDIPFVPQFEGVLSTSAGAALSLKSTGVGMDGYAVVSTSTN